MRPYGIVVAVLFFTASPAFAEEVLYCVDTDVVGFKWDKDGHSSTPNFVLSRFTVKIGPAEKPFSLDANDRIVTQTSKGEGAGFPLLLKCATRKTITGHVQATCDDELSGQPWRFIDNSYYVRAFLNGGPRPLGLDPNIAIAYGTCTKF